MLCEMDSYRGESCYPRDGVDIAQILADRIAAEKAILEIQQNPNPIDSSAKLNSSTPQVRYDGFTTADRWFMRAGAVTTGLGLGVGAHEIFSGRMLTGMLAIAAGSMGNVLSFLAIDIKEEFRLDVRLPHLRNPFRSKS